MKLYTPSNTLLLDIEVDDTSVRYRSIMQDNNLTLNFSTVEPVSVPVGSYCTFEEQRYTLYYPENFKKVNTRNFEYTLVLHSHQEALKLYKYKDLSAKPYRLKFPLTAKPFDFVKLLVDNLNQNGSGWSVGSYIDTDDKLISFNHEYCYDVLNRIAQEFNTEWEIENKTIHLRKIEKFKDAPLALSYGKANGFKSGVARQNDGDKQPIGKLYVQGGDRNIDYSTYGSQTLLLPKNATLEYDGKTYKTDADGMYITRVGNNNVAEDSYDASSVYPKRVGTISSVVVADAEKSFYDIIDSSIPENLNYRDCIIAGEKATIVFQSGALAAREFDILQTETDLTGYDHAQRKFEIVPQELDGMIMPSGVYVPKVGDKYAIFNISMPKAYISDNTTKSGASWDMFREAVKFFSEHEDARFTFRGELDGIWSKDKWLEIGAKITVGGHVLFSDNQFLPNGEVIRIVSIKDYVNMPHKPEITLSNAPVSGNFGSTLGKLEAEEVIRDEQKKDILRINKRQWRDAKETMDLLQDMILDFPGFTDSISPITVQALQLIVGDESLQFRFVTSKTNPQPTNHDVVFNKENKTLNVSAGIMQHMTIGITTLKKSHAPNEYKYWDVASYISPPLDASKPYYLYAKCSKDNQSGAFILSETSIKMESVAGYYHFLVGILNSESNEERSFARLYGFAEILPGQITTDRISSQDGRTYFDLLTGVIAGNIKFVSSGSEHDLGDWAGGITGDVTDAQQKALDAERKAQQAIQDAENAVSDYNAKFALQQQQIDGQVSNWFYPYSPTLSNYPANTWVANADKDRHVGDTFTNTQNIPLIDAGKSWRFVKSGSTYEWSQISDSDALLALQKASEAQSTADGKSTTFMVQPYNYDVGDMWVLNADSTVNGTAYKQGDILTATQKSEVYNQAHWLKRVRYTDDTAFDELEIGGRNLIKRTDILKWKNIAGIGFSEGVDSFGQYYRYQFSVLTSESNAFPYIKFKDNIQYALSVEGIIETGVGCHFKFKYTDGSESAAAYYDGNGALKSSHIISQKGKTVRNIFHYHNRYGYARLYNIQLTEGNKPVNGWLKAPEDVQDEIDNIEVGTRNLILRRDMLNWTNRIWSTDEVGEYVEAHIANIGDRPFPSIKFEPNTQYRFTGIIKWISGSGNGLRFKYSDGTTTTICQAYNSTPIISCDAISDKLKTVVAIERLWANGGSTRYYQTMLVRGNKKADYNKAPEDVQDEINKAQADASLSRAITDKFGTTIDGGLVSAVTILLRALNSNNVTAGMTGIQDGAAFWAGGTYAQAIATYNFLQKVQSGQTPSAGEYASLASVMIGHDGTSKLGHLLAQESGQVVMVDPLTGKPRLIFQADNIPSIDELNNKNSASDTVNLTGANVNFGGTTSSYLGGTLNVARDASTINTGSVPFSAQGIINNTDAAFMAELHLMRNGVEHTLLDFGHIQHGQDVYSHTVAPRVFSNMPKGSYRMRLKISALGNTNQSSATAFAGSTQMSYSFQQAGVRYFQFGLDGMMAYFSDNHIHFTELGGWDVRGKTNMPGVLASGTVASNGAQANVWGAKSSITGTTAITGGRRVPLSFLDHNNYTVMITPHTSTTPFRVGTKTQTGFVALGTGAFDYTVIGKNYI